MLERSGNPNGRPNGDVVRPWVNGLDIAQRPREMWIIDFGTDIAWKRQPDYEAPFEYVRAVREASTRRTDERATAASGGCTPSPDRGCAAHRRTARVSSPRQRWQSTGSSSGCRLSTCQITNSSSSLAADDYFFGVLQSQSPRTLGAGVKARSSGRPATSLHPHHHLRDLPLPLAARQGAGRRPARRRHRGRGPRPRREARRLAQPARRSEAELKKRTLTNLYNARPDWLELAHRRLDEAVLDAYGWPADLADEEILARLLALNLERAG